MFSSSCLWRSRGGGYVDPPLLHQFAKHLFAIRQRAGRPPLFIQRMVVRLRGIALLGMELNLEGSATRVLERRVHPLVGIARGPCVLVIGELVTLRLQVFDDLLFG